MRQQLSNQKIFLIFSGGNDRAIIAFCRQLVTAKLQFAIVARTEADFIFKTSYKQYVYATRSTHRLDCHDIQQCIDQVKAKTEVNTFVVCPSSEYLNLFLLQNKDFFESQNCFIPLVDLERYELVSNKASFADLCRLSEIQTPERLPDFRATNLPFVARPIKNVNSTGRSLYPYLFFTSQQIEGFEAVEDPKEYYFEKFVQGESYYLLLYLSKFDGVIKFSQQNLLQQANGKSVLLARSAQIHKQSEVADKFINMLRSADFWGLAMIELRYNNGTYTAIEMNPRLWGPSQLFIEAGSSIYRAFIHESLYDTPYVDQDTSSSARYLWLNGLTQNLLAGIKPQWHPYSTGEAKWQLLMQSIFSDVYLKRDTARLFFYEFFQGFK